MNANQKEAMQAGADAARAATSRAVADAVEALKGAAQFARDRGEDGWADTFEADAKKLAEAFEQ